MSGVRGLCLRAPEQGEWGGETGLELGSRKGVGSLSSDASR